MADDPEQLLAQIIPFPGAAPRRLDGPANPVGGRPIANEERFVYDIRREGCDYAVTFRGKALTRHDSLDAAIENARLIAGNFWKLGRPSLVRVVNEDATVTPLVSFG